MLVLLAPETVRKDSFFCRKIFRCCSFKLINLFILVYSQVIETKAHSKMRHFYKLYNNYSNTRIAS